MAGIGDYEKGKAFSLKSGNTASFKQMGSSPLKQAIGGGAGEALTHWKKYKEGLKKIIPGDAINKELTRVAKGGKVKAKLLSEGLTDKKKARRLVAKTAKRAAKKGLAQTIKTGLKKGLGFLGGKALGVAGMMQATSATATQPGTGKHGGKKTGKYNPKSGKYE